LANEADISNLFWKYHLNVWCDLVSEIRLETIEISLSRLAMAFPALNLSILAGNPGCLGVVTHFKTISAASGRVLPSVKRSPQFCDSSGTLDFVSCDRLSINSDNS
jgi:hypothetical protein